MIMLIMQQLESQMEYLPNWEIHHKIVCVHHIVFFILKNVELLCIINATVNENS